MTLERSKEWWVERAHREGDAFVAAGLLAFDPGSEEPDDTRVAEESRIAFGKFVNLMRRSQGFSIEEFADVAEVDASELLIIEENAYHEPAPRTIYQLARIFKIPQPRLMQLAGLTVANDDSLREEAVRFAARSEAVQKLTPEEIAALEAFVAVLSMRGSPKSREER